MLGVPLICMDFFIWSKRLEPITAGILNATSWVTTAHAQLPKVMLKEDVVIGNKSMTIQGFVAHQSHLDLAWLKGKASITFPSGQKTVRKTSYTFELSSQEVLSMSARSLIKRG